MHKPWLTSIALLSVTAATAAADFDGSQPMTCLPSQGHDCLPTEKTCKPLRPESGKDLRMHFNMATKSVRTPYRNETLPIQALGANTESLVMQGTTLQLVWSATVHRRTGRLTIVIADREGAYVIFGQCTLVDTALPPD